MTPKHILAFSVVVFVIFLGLVGIIDALEPGHTLTAIETGELGAAFVALAAAAIGVAVGRRFAKRKESTDEELSDGGDTD